MIISVIWLVYNEAIADRSIIPPPYPIHNRAKFLLERFANPLAIPSFEPNKITAAKTPNCHNALNISIITPINSRIIKISDVIIYVIQYINIFLSIKEKKFIFR